MHLCFNFDACPMHSPSGFVHLTHQNLSARALFCLNSFAKVNTQLLIYKYKINSQNICICFHLDYRVKLLYITKLVTSWTPSHHYYQVVPIAIGGDHLMVSSRLPSISYIDNTWTRMAQSLVIWKGSRQKTVAKSWKGLHPMVDWQSVVRSEKQAAFKK